MHGWCSWGSWPWCAAQLAGADLGDLRQVEVEQARFDRQLQRQPRQLGRGALQCGRFGVAEQAQQRQPVGAQRVVVTDTAYRPVRAARDVRQFVVPGQRAAPGRPRPPAVRRCPGWPRRRAGAATSAAARSRSSSSNSATSSAIWSCTKAGQRQQQLAVGDAGPARRRRRREARRSGPTTTARAAQVHAVLVDLVEFALEHAGLAQQRALRAADRLGEPMRGGVQFVVPR